MHDSHPCLGCLWFRIQPSLNVWLYMCGSGLTLWFSQFSGLTHNFDLFSAIPGSANRKCQLVAEPL